MLETTRLTQPDIFALALDALDAQHIELSSMSPKVWYKRAIFDYTRQQAGRVRHQPRLARTFVRQRLPSMPQIPSGRSAPLELLMSETGRCPSPVQDCIAAVGAKSAYIEPGSPWENGYIESFNARLRDELLNGGSSIRCVKPRSSSRAGDVTTTPFGRMPLSATNHQLRRSSCLCYPRGRLPVGLARGGAKRTRLTQSNA
jgi:Integrase core domain